jgi:hypothetical protein
MNKFEFEVVEYFKFSNNQICISGFMEPNDAACVTSGYKVTLFTASGKSQEFTLIGEEIFAFSWPRKDNKRVLRTADDIEEYLKNLAIDPVKVIGYKQ